MGVDISTYRARIDQFHGGRSQIPSTEGTQTQDSVRTALLLNVVPDLLKKLDENYDVNAGNSLELCLLVEKLGLQWQSRYINTHAIPVFTTKDIHQSGYQAQVIHLLLLMSG